ncbi:unnamed protein product [Danaus chrysippus]|uniref:(African queen) hypothetical protein n=1 Tax=Danaus chrysippus TaxID=151541 RepID=A0A8J2WDF7_9NEOP|nr:unnamed protein product [Danaus chrysippus]
MLTLACCSVCCNSIGSPHSSTRFVRGALFSIEPRPRVTTCPRYHGLTFAQAALRPNGMTAVHSRESVERNLLANNCTCAMKLSQRR